MIKCICHDPLCEATLDTTFVDTHHVMLNVVERSQNREGSIAAIWLDRKATEELIADLQRKLEVLSGHL